MIQLYMKRAVICLILAVSKADIVLDRICNRFQDKAFCRQNTTPHQSSASNHQQIVHGQPSTMAPGAKTDFCSQNKNNFVGYCAAKAGQYELDRPVNNFCNEYLNKCDTTKNPLPAYTPGLGSMPGGPSYLPTVPQMMGQYLGNYSPTTSQNNLYQMPSVGAAVMNIAPQRDPAFMGMPIVPMLNNWYYMMGLPSANEMMAMMPSYPKFASPMG